MVVGLGLAIRLDAVYEQGSHGKGNPYPHHACPSIMLPGQARNESSGRTTQEINGHINGIDTVDGRCVKGYYAGMLSCNMAANAGNDKPIAVNALPAKAQTLLSNHFNNQKVMLATIETGVINKSYDVVLQNGTKLEFDKKGNLTEIDCKQGKVPAKLIPQAIRNYLKENYPAQAVKKIEMNKNEYEVELANGLDLTFNKHFQVIDID